MKINIKLIIVFLVFIMSFGLLSNEAQAWYYYFPNYYTTGSTTTYIEEKPVYSINEIKIDMDVLENGDLDISQTIIVKNISTGENKINLNLLNNFKDNKEPNNLYPLYDKSVELEIHSVNEMKTDKELEIEYSKFENSYSTGNKNNSQDKETLVPQYKISGKSVEIYPTEIGDKVFNIKYTVKNACRKFKDCGELYFSVEDFTKYNIKLEMNINLQKNNKKLKIWEYYKKYEYSKLVKIDKDMLDTQIIENSKIKVKLDNPYQLAKQDFRILFDKECISMYNYEIDEKAYDKICNYNGDITENNINNVIKIFIILLLYWIVLLLIFEVDKRLDITNVDEDEIFKKYTPMLAGCLEGGRDVLPRDIIAEILNLIDKKYIILEIENDISLKDNYKYFIKRNVRTEEKMSYIERNIYDWIFEKKDKVELIERIKELPKKKKNIKKFKALNVMAQKELNKIGANKNKVPYIIRVINTVLWICTFLNLFRHLNILDKFTEFEHKVNNKQISIFLLIFLILVIFLPKICFGIRYRVAKKLYKLTENKVIVMTMTILLISMVILIVILLSGEKLEKIIKVDLFVIMMTAVIMLTDNIMMKNNANRIEDYSRLRLLKEKIKEYSLISEKDIEHIILWDKYMAYGVSFGIVEKVQTKYGNIMIDNKVLEMLNSYEFNSLVISTYMSYDRVVKEYNDKKNK